MAIGLSPQHLVTGVLGAPTQVRDLSELTPAAEELRKRGGVARTTGDNQDEGLAYGPDGWWPSCPRFA